MRVCFRDTSNTFRSEFVSGIHQTPAGESLHQGNAKHFQVRVCISDTPNTFRWECASVIHWTLSGESVRSGTHRKPGGESKRQDKMKIQRYRRHEDRKRHRDGINRKTDRQKITEMDRQKRTEIYRQKCTDMDRQNVQRWIDRKWTEMHG